MQSGKSDGPTQCGATSCLPELCGYDCRTSGEQATESCADTDGRSSTFVAASIGGSASGSFDTRTNPYAPVVSVDNVLVYGCELWDFSSGLYDGLEVDYEELIHGTIAASATPATTKQQLGLYISHFAGPGSYRAEAQYRPTSDASWFAQKDACSVDVAVDAAGMVTGSFSCSIGSDSGGSVSATGTFGCAKNAMDPIFSTWAAAPR